ncbi:unnamed protein product [Meloidogyne enterolobii]|uniref:Uncharacterized protein n=1 Tax=Meloidogyne enterolobii TaxID=390850 RepID=A0ACB0XKI8_MELEN
MAQQTQREAALEGVELTGPWAQLWIRTRTFDYLLSNLKNIGRAFLLFFLATNDLNDYQNFNFKIQTKFFFDFCQFNQAFALNLWYSCVISPHFIFLLLSFLFSIKITHESD